MDRASRCTNVDIHSKRQSVDGYPRCGRSDLRHTQIGVPQSSMLGSILFILYINDICSFLNTSIFLYANIATVVVSANDSNVGADVQSHINDLFS